MTPERIAELRKMLDRVGYGSSMAVAKPELADLLATAEREARRCEVIEQVYRACPRREGDGYYVNGPRTGMDYYASDRPSLKNIFPDREQAERAAALMSMTYQYGREAAQAEIRKAIGA